MYYISMYRNKYNRVTKLNRSEIKIFHKTDSNPTYGELEKSGFMQLTSHIPNNLESFFFESFFFYNSNFRLSFIDRLPSFTNCLSLII